MSEHDDETAGADVDPEDAGIAETVDDRAGELSGSKPSPQPAGVTGDPIGAAEDHIASLDMDEERRKLEDLQKGM